MKINGRRVAMYRKKLPCVRRKMERQVKNTYANNQTVLRGDTYACTCMHMYVFAWRTTYAQRKNKIKTKKVENLIWHLRALPQYNLTDCGASCARLQLKLKLKLNSHKITWNVQKMRLQKQKKKHEEKMSKFFEIENNVWVAVRHERL